MNINPAIPTPSPATQPGGSPLGNDPAKKAGAGGADQAERANFSQKLQTPAQPQPTEAIKTPDASSAVGKNNNVTNTQQVSTNNSVPDNQDMFSQFEKAKKDVDSYMQRTNETDTLVAQGKLKPDDARVIQQHREEMRTLLHLQSEMQSSAVKIEIASKVVENGTTGIKTVLQTQA